MNLVYFCQYNKECIFKIMDIWNKAVFIETETLILDLSKMQFCNTSAGFIFAGFSKIRKYNYSAE